MNHHLPARVVREVLAHDNEHWVRKWAERGWSPEAPPELVGRTSTGREVLRHVLVHAVDAEHTPGFPFVPPFGEVLDPAPAGAIADPRDGGAGSATGV